jgi:hypothetical protein
MSLRRPLRRRRGSWSHGRALAPLPAAARPLALAPLVALGLLFAVLPASTLDAQKSTIQGRGSGSGGRSAAAMRPSGRPPSGGSLRPSGRPSSGGIASRPSRGPVAAGTIGGERAPRQTIASAPTLSPDFPLRGRVEPRVGQPAVPAQPAAPAGGALRPSGRTGDPAKGYIRDLDDRRPDRDGRRFDDDWRWRRGHDRDRVRVVLYQPWFYDPWLRYHRFDRFRYSFGLGCGFYDRWLPGFYGWRSYDPCFSSFGLFLGWPGFGDPWPGFWTWGFYGSEYANGYRRGFDEGFERGYGSGSVAPAPSYDAAPAPGYRADVAPAPPLGGASPGIAGGADGYFRGRELMQAGDYAGALAAFDRHVDAAPGDAAAHLARGLDLTALGHYGKAAEAIRRGLDARDPWQPAAVDAPAHFASRAEFRRVLADLEAYVRLHADNADARLVLGAVYLFSGERDAAGAVLRSLPDDAHALYLLGTLTR